MNHSVNARTSPIHFHDDLVAEYRRHHGNMSRDTALMLRTSLAVLRSQWKHVSGSIAARKAYARGIRAWQAYYAHELFAAGAALVTCSL